MQDTSGVHVWWVLVKAFHALRAHAEESLNLSRQASATRFSRPRSAAPQGTVAGQ